jgi:Ca-activated chloride channel family protein
MACGMRYRSFRKGKEGETMRVRIEMALLLLLIFISPVIAEHPVELGDIGAGDLLRKSGRGLIPLPLSGTEVELAVTGMIIHGRLTQHFHNPTDQTIEAIYVFPLPERAAVHFMEIRIGERRIVSEIQEKQEARRTYEWAKESGRKAALVNQRRPNLFTTEVANINPGESISVVLEYLEEADYSDGLFALRFPLTSTPRFMPPDDGCASGSEPPPELAAPFIGRDAAALPAATVSVVLEPGMELDDVASESHDIEVSRRDGAYDVSPVEKLIAADRDFILRWKPRLGREPRAAVFIEERDEAAYAMVMLMPPQPESGAALGLPTETLFIIDVSGSMDGPSIKQARRALTAALDRLRPEDRFNILKFNDRNAAFRDQFQQAVPENIDAARSWVRDLQATGGTMIQPALERGLELMNASGSSHAQRIVFLTDGAVGNESQVLRLITSGLGEARLHTIGIGHAPNSYLMRKMAAFGRGLCDFISNIGDAENRIAAFLERLDRPVMTDLEMSWEGISVDEVYPERPKDLYAGEPLVVTAKLAAPPEPGLMRLSGWTREGWTTGEALIDAGSPRGTGIGRRWARAKIGSLMDSLHEGADPEAVRAEVVDLAIGFNLVTSYTSLVAVDDRASALEDPESVRIAAALPAGGTFNPLHRLVALALLGAGIVLLAGARWGMR